MKINLLRNYGGWNTHEQRIEPGVYDADDGRLFGLAAYLIENGHAVAVIEESGNDQSNNLPYTVTEIQSATRTIDADLSGTPIPHTETDEYPYEQWSFNDLRAEITWRQISKDTIARSGKNGAANKEDLIEALRSYDSTLSR